MPAIPGIDHAAGMERLCEVVESGRLPCLRCGGYGIYAHYGTCFRCGGACADPEQPKHLDKSKAMARARERAREWRTRFPETGGQSAQETAP